MIEEELLGFDQPRASMAAQAQQEVSKSCEASMEKMLMMALLISAILALSAVAVSSDDGSDSFSRT